MNHMAQAPTYLDQTLEAVRFYAKLNKAFRKFEPDYVEMSQNFIEKQSPQHRGEFNHLLNKFIKPLGETYLQQYPGDIAHSCHAVSQGFYETWMRLPDVPPLNITIGNVYFQGENLYQVSKTSIKRILNEGNQVDKTIDLHVWLTLDDLTVIDLTILSTLRAKSLLQEQSIDSNVLIWREEDPGEFRFEPLLIDNSFFQKVDSGRFQRMS